MPIGRHCVWIASLVCLFTSSGRGLEPDALAPVRVVVPALVEAPSLADGLTAAAWSGATRLPCFVRFRSGEPPRYSAAVRFGQRPDALYVAWECHGAPGARPVVKTTVRDGLVHADDSIELYLALPSPAGTDAFYQFLLNASNTQADLRYSPGADIGWDGEWESAAIVQENGWVALMCIPWRTLGLDAPPAELRFVCARTTLAPESEQSVFPWTSRVAFQEEMDGAGLLTLLPTFPAAALTCTGDRETGRIEVTARVVGLPRGGAATSVLTARTADGTIVASDTQQPRFDARMVAHRLSDLPDGPYLLRHTLAPARSIAIPAYYGGGQAEGEPSPDTSERTALVEWPVVVSRKPGLQVDLRLRDRGGMLACRLIPRGGIRPATDDPFVYRFAVLNEDGSRNLAHLPAAPFRPGPLDYRALLPALPPRGRYVLRTGLSNKAGVLVETRTPFATPPTADWLGNTDGLPRGVPAPWEPVRLDGRRVTVWGRSYDFGHGPAPSRIVSHGTSWLAAPCRLVIDPAPAAWSLTAAVLEGPAESPTAAVLRWSASEGEVAYTAVTRVEFDGTIRVDLDVPARADVRRCALEIPCRADLATFVHRGPVRWGGFRTTYPLPTSSEAHGILPNFYLLNDTGGVCWFNGMPFDWHLSRPGAAVELIPDAGVALLRINYIDGGRSYPIERRFTMGLQAMPARPMPRSSRGLRSTHLYRYGYEDAATHPAWFSTVDYWADGCISNDIGTAEIWFQPDFDPALHSTEEPFLRIMHGPGYRAVLAWRPDGKGLSAGLWDAYRARASIESGIQPATSRWTHVALTWGDEIALAVDGTIVDRIPRAGLLGVAPVNIYAGGRRVRVDGFRVSCRPRTTFGLDRPPGMDDATLLLDNFDRLAWVNGRRATLPERIGARAEAGYLSPDAALGPGRWGQGIDALRVPVISTLEGYARLGIKQIMFHSLQYTDEACAGLYIADESRFRKALDTIHALGMDAVMYVNNSLSTRDRMWDAYADDMLIEPRGTPFVQAWIPDEKLYQACPYSEYRDYWFWRLGRLMDEYDVDGFFLDGRMYTTCANTNHGCGTVNFEGQPVPSRDIWEGRSNQWRMYNVIHERGGYSEQHKSAQWDAPTCFFWDCVWEGEQLMGQKRNGRKNLEIMPLAAMRAQLNGFPYGMPVRNETVAFAPFTPIELCTYCFVHGTAPGVTYRADELLVIAPFFEALDTFGADLHNFMGYWSARAPTLETPHELVKVSAHVTEGRALVMVANFDEERGKVEGSVRLNLPALGLRKPRARDAFSGEPVELVGGDRLPVSVRSFRQGWFLLEE